MAYPLSLLGIPKQPKDKAKKDSTRKNFAKGGKVPGRQNFAAGDEVGTGWAGALMGYQSGQQNNSGNLSQANAGVQNSLGNQTGLMNQQQALNNAYAGQNGLANQSAVFNQQQALAGQQLGLAGQQQGLVGQYQNIANGTGPNPAQAMLAQATGANVANQAALMAGQRGAGANAGLIARQAAQQGAATQQNAAGQAATMQANQSLNALGQIGAQQQAIGNTLGAAGNTYNAAGAGANQMVAQQQGGINAAQAMQNSNLQGQLANQSTQTGLQATQNQVNADISKSNAANTKGIVSGAMNAVGSIFGLANGGQVPQNFDMGGLSTPGGPSDTGLDISGVPGGPADTGLFSSSPASAASAGTSPMNFGQSLAKGLSGKSSDKAPVAPTKVAPYHEYAKGGKVPAMVSPGEKVIPKKDVPAVAAGMKSALNAGKTVPGKPKVPGAKDSLKNDTVPADLEAGSIVLPRSVTQSKNPHWAAHKFVSAIMKEKGLKK